MDDPESTGQREVIFYEPWILPDFSTTLSRAQLGRPIRFGFQLFVVFSFSFSFLFLFFIFVFFSFLFSFFLIIFLFFVVF